MQSVTDFYLSFVKNRSIDLGKEMWPVLYDIIVIIAGLYYETENKVFKSNAMSLLSFINNSPKYSGLLDNV